MIGAQQKKSVTTMKKKRRAISKSFATTGVEELVSLTTQKSRP
jgi:hypothetical protein